LNADFAREVDSQLRGVTLLAALAVLAVAFSSSDTPPPLTSVAQAPVAQAPVTSGKPAPLKPALPLGISSQLYALAVAPGQEPTAQLAALGDKLFDDKRLSVDDSVACKTCTSPPRIYRSSR